MKPLRSYLIAISLLYSLFQTAQTTNFLKTFTPTPTFSTNSIYMLNSMYPQGVATINPSSFILGGYYSRVSKSTNDTLIEDSYLIKNQNDGLTKWFRKYHLANRRLMFYDIGIKYNKEIIAVGRSNQTNSDGTLLTTDSNGYLKSVRLYSKQPLLKITILKDKKIAILTSERNTFLKLVMLDKNANLIWSKTLYHSDTSCCSYNGYELVEGANKSLLVLGYKFINYPNGHNPSYIWYPFAMLADSNGNKINDFIMPIGNSIFLNGTNNFNDGFYIVGEGTSLVNGQNLYGHLLKVNNQLQIKWYKLFQCNYTHVEFTDIALYSKNNISILTEPEPSSGHSRRAGFTFMDSSGTVRKSFLFNPINTDQYPDKMIPIQNGKVLFTLHSNSGRLFGVTDTVQSGFCNTDVLTWTQSGVRIAAQYNNLTLINSTFNFIKDTAYVYTPKDAELDYVCSSGPNGALDTINYPPPTPPTTLTTLELSDEMEEETNHYFIHPNPACDYLTISTNIPSKFPIEIEIFNSLGSTIMKKKLFNYSFPYTIDVNNLSQGLYVVFIKTLNNYGYKTKFVISRRE